MPGFSGHIRVKGSDFLIKARGNISFLAKGSGTAFLEGQGRWHAPGIAGTWSGVTIAYR